MATITEPTVTAAPEVTEERKPMEHVAIICSKGTLDMAYPGLILANAARMSGIDATLFFTFWGLDIITKKTHDRLHVSTVGDPSMGMPTMLGGLPGMEAFATTMMKKEMEKLDIPSVTKGMAGAGAALSLNSMAPATNPAALAFLGPRWDLGVGLFNPNRFYDVTGQPTGFPGTFGLVPGRVESDSRYFPIPHLGADFQAGENGAFGVALYGNGGMNTTWPTETFYAGQPTGVDLS